VKSVRSIRLLLVFGLIGLLVVDATGCSPQWRRKFVRKRKDAPAASQPILEFQSNEQATYPPAVRYQEHFAYWKSWHSELLKTLGEIHKRDLRYLAGTMGELRAMAQLLSGPSANRLEAILVELSGLEEKWRGSGESYQPTSAVRTRLEQLSREIDRDFQYSKVKAWIPLGTSPSSSS